ncbi:MAG: 50S ribosomal protein L9 [Candidatus Cloacimonetes bacterium]|jgi:large subunit ribosomal protein L9|nr:50S ribosomal protein L9 [Candidatus Cloacimonadota bacterium]
MNVILTKDIKALGEAGKLVKVKPGYARNYLLPNGFAIHASPKNLTKIEVIKTQAADEKIALHGKYKEVLDKIKGVELTFNRRADENNHLFGSVSENDIVKALAEKEIEVHKADIVMEKHLKEVGTFEVEISFTSELTTSVNVKIDVENVDVENIVDNIEVKQNNDIETENE